MTDLRQVPLVAIIDGNRDHREDLAATLRPFYRVETFPDTARTIPELRRQRPEVVMVDEHAAPYGGPEFVQMMGRDQTLSRLSTILLSRGREPHAADAARQCGATTYLLVPCSGALLVKTVSRVINRTVEAGWNALPKIQRDTLKGTRAVFDSIADVIETGVPIDYGMVRDACAPLITVISEHSFSSLLDGVRDHDNYTFAHSLKVATMLCLFGSVIGLSQDEQLLLACGGLLHDTGKMLIPLGVLNKSGRLDADEWRVMKLHVPNTIHFLEANSGIPKGARLIAEQHHEKLDGTGYPNGLQGKTINDLARMAAIVDVYSALTDRRVYKPSMAPAHAFEIMEHQMGNHLDQRLLKLFRTMMLDTAASRSGL